MGRDPGPELITAEQNLVAVLPFDEFAEDPVVDFTQSNEQYVLCKVPVHIYQRLRELYPIRTTVHCPAADTTCKARNPKVDPAVKNKRPVKRSWTASEVHAHA